MSPSHSPLIAHRTSLIAFCAHSRSPTWLQLETGSPFSFTPRTQRSRVQGSVSSQSASERQPSAVRTPAADRKGVAMAPAVWHEASMRPRQRTFWLLLRAIVASLVLLQAGAGSTFAGARCSSGCAADDAQGRCPPTCDDCACCAHPPLLAAPRFATPRVVVMPRPLVTGEPRAIQAEAAGRVFRPPRLEPSHARS